jgi:hypothetical protein
MKAVQAARRSLQPSKGTARTSTREFSQLFLLLWVIFMALLDPGPDPKSMGRIHANADVHPDPQH